MSQIKRIRLLLGLTQDAFAKALGCVQGNIVHYEKGRSLPEARARRLIGLAREKGIELTFDHVYGQAPLPDHCAESQASE